MARGGDGAQLERAQADRQVVIEHCVDTRRGERLVHAELRSFAAVSLAMTGRLRARRSALRRCAAAARQPADVIEMHVAPEQYFHVLEAEAERADVVGPGRPCRAAVDQCARLRR